MTLGNMREQGVHHLIGFCHNDACRRQALTDVSSYPGDTPVPWFGSKVKCGKCGARGRRIDARPNSKEKPDSIDNWSGQPAMPGGRTDAPPWLHRAVPPDQRRGAVPTGPLWAQATSC
jgi:hypothetical protein